MNTQPSIIAETVNYWSISKITNVDHVKLFISHLINQLHLNFHPDTPFNDYANETGDTFTDAQCAILTDRINECFEVCASTNTDIYEISMAILNIATFPKYNPNDPTPSATAGDWFKKHLEFFRSTYFPHIANLTEARMCTPEDEGEYTIDGADTEGHPSNTNMWLSISTNEAHFNELNGKLDSAYNEVFAPFAKLATDHGYIDPEIIPMEDNYSFSFNIYYPNK